MVCEGWEGQTVDGKFPLLEWLGGWTDRCVFLTVLQSTYRANIRLILASGTDAEAYLSKWDTAKRLSHPSLVRLLETGRHTIDGSDVVYVVSEKADAFLSGTVPRKAIDAAEAVQIFHPVVDALSYVHRNGFIHGSINPSNVVQVGEQWKLTSDEVIAVGELLRLTRQPGVYDAPEVMAGNLTQASDLWSLGVMIVEAFTQRAPVLGNEARVDPAVPDSLPEPFRVIARRCLRWEPADRLSIEQVESLLSKFKEKADSGIPAPTIEGEAVQENKPRAEIVPPVPVEATNKEEAVVSHQQQSKWRDERVAERAEAREEEAAELAPRARLFTNLGEEEEEHEGRSGSLIFVVLLLAAVAGAGWFGYKHKFWRTTEPQTPVAKSSQPVQPTQPPQAQPSPSQAPQAQPSETPPPQATTEPQATSEQQNKPAEVSSAHPDQTPPAQQGDQAGGRAQAQAKAPAVAQAPTSASTPRDAKKELQPRRESAPRIMDAQGAVATRVLPNVSPAATESMHGPVRVELRVFVDENGKVTDAEPMTQGSGNYFVRISRQAARGWIFRAPVSDGVAKASQWILLFQFERRRVDVTATETR